MPGGQGPFGGPPGSPPRPPGPPEPPLGPGGAPPGGGPQPPPPPPPGPPPTPSSLDARTTSCRQRPPRRFPGWSSSRWPTRQRTPWPPRGWRTSDRSVSTARKPRQPLPLLLQCQGPARNKNDHGAEVHEALAHKGRLDIQKPEMFSSCNPRKWRTFLVQCLNTFQGKAHTYASNQARVAFASSYLQGIALDHYTTILRYNPRHPPFSDWQAFVQEFLEKFGVYDTVAEAENNLVNLK
ncbi:hypothetical protein C0992_012941, partial [Termitomyces sp. T32_za158]